MKRSKTIKNIARIMLSFLLIVSMLPLSVFASVSSDNGDGTFNNPVIYSDVPDIDVIRVDDTYYMSSTTMHLSPGVPIMKSKDLVNWEIVNYVYNIMDDGDKMSLRNGQNAYANGSWASSLRYHDGKYYVGFGSYTSGKTYFYTTDDIENGVWSHTEVNGMYHDMSLFFDDDGKVYMAYGGTNLKIVEMKIVENGLEIVPGTTADFIDDVWKGSPLQGDTSFLYGEGVHLQKIDGKYYAFVISWPPNNAAAGTEGMRTELCFRADSIEQFKQGKWERKIVLSDKGAAQGGIIDTEDGDWYGMVFRDMGAVGRCPVLVPVTWVDDWPMMGNARGEVDDKMTMPLPSVGKTNIVESDEFYNNAERPAYTYQQELNKSLGFSVKNATVKATEGVQTRVSNGQELIENGGFDDGQANWTVNDPCSIEVMKEGDNNILKVTGRTATGSGPRQDITGDVVIGGTYKISAKIKYDNPNSPNSTVFNMCIYNGESYVNGDSIQIMGSGTVTKGQWGTVEGTFTIKDGTDISASAIFLETNWVQNPDKDTNLMDFYVDDVSVVAQNIPTGNPNNMLENGSFEGNLNGWTGRENCTLTLDTEEKVSGDSGVKVTDRRVTGSGPQQNVSNMFNPGDTIEVSYYVKYTTGPDTRRFYITAYDGANYTNIVGGNATKGQWTKVSGSFVIPEGMNVGNLVFFLETSWTQEQDQANDLMDYYVDDVEVIRTKVAEKESAGSNDYNGSNLKLQWQWNHNPDNSKWSLTERNGYLRLKTVNITDTITGARNTLSQRTYAPQCSGSVALEVGNMKNGDVAGLSAFAAKYGYVGVKMTGGQKYLVMVGTQGNSNFQPYEAASIPLNQNRVYLKIDFDFTNANKAYFYYSLNGKTWTKIGDDLGMVYSLEHFMGYRFGLFNYATQTRGGYVDFDYFRVEDGLTGTAGTKTVGTVSMGNAEVTGIQNMEVEVPVYLDTLPEGNYDSIEASFNIPDSLIVSGVEFDAGNVTGEGSYKFEGGQLLLTVTGDEVDFVPASDEDNVFATIKLKVADYAFENTKAVITADYVKTTGDVVTYDAVDAKSEVTLKYLDMGALAKKPGMSNPLIDHKFGADPYAMEYDGRIYIYMTNDSQEYAATNNGQTDNSYGNINTINVISSADMVNWTDHGSIPVAGRNNPEGAAKWASCSWAPAAAHKTIDGEEKFFLYFADGGGGIGVLTSDSPIGPFVDPIGKALIPPGSAAASGVVWLFDPAVLVDDDGEGYLYYGGGVPSGQADNPKTSRAIKLADDMIHTEGDAVVIDAPAIFEDSGIHKLGDKYYYSYCSNFDQHSPGYPGQGIICYMVSDNPMGPWEYVGEVFSNPSTFFGVGGNNHHAFFEFKGQYYLTYHAQTVGKALGKANGYRSTHIDKATILSDGTILPITGTYDGVSQLETVDPYQRLEGEMVAWNKGIKTQVSNQEGAMVAELNMEVMDIQKGDWTAITGIDFGENGANKLEANVAGLSEDAYIEVRLDSTEGEIIGVLEVPYTEGEYEVVDCDLDKVTGEHTIFFVFNGAEGENLMTVDYWEFVEDTSVNPPKPTLPYEDVASGDWFYDAVKYTFEEGLMTGLDETHFGPYGNLSRAQFALILHRMEGEDKVETDKKFGDIAGDEWYGPAVLWAAENGIVTGYENGNFGPVDLITREQMAVMMYRYAKYLKQDVTVDADFDNFKDAASVSPFATEAMKWAVGNGIITGKEGGTVLDPQGNTARSEAAIIIQRFMDK